jgi:hypothetical protein
MPRTVVRKRLMLTWPWVTIEWKTPAIHTVEVSAVSSGTRCRPLRRMWPCGRMHALLLGAQHHVRASSPWKKLSSVPASVSAWRRVLPKCVSSSRG